MAVVFSAVTYCEFLQCYCDVSVGYNRHLHHTIANHLIWISTFTVLLIRDIETGRLNVLM